MIKNKIIPGVVLMMPQSQRLLFDEAAMSNT